MKLVLTALLSDKKINVLMIPKLMLDYNWEIEELGEHNYHIIASHPIAKRLDFYLEKTVIH